MNQMSLIHIFLYCTHYRKHGIDFALVKFDEYKIRFLHGERK